MKDCIFTMYFEGDKKCDKEIDLTRTQVTCCNNCEIQKEAVELVKMIIETKEEEF